jgi:hypothetical protein
MTIQKQVEDLITATEPMWNKVIAEAVLKVVPESEKSALLDVLIALRVHDITMGLRYAKKTGTPKAKAKFMQEMYNKANVIAAQIEHNLNTTN